MRFGPSITCALIGAALLAPFVAPRPSAAELRTGVTISEQLDGISEFRPRIRGGAVVWQKGSGNGSEVMYWDGERARNLTQNGVADENPETDGIHVIWQNTNGAQRDIAIYDIVTRTTTFFSSPQDEVFPLISGIHVAWIRNGDADGELFIDPGPLGNQVTGNFLVEESLQFSGTDLVWSQADRLMLTPDTSDDDGDIAVWNSELQGLFLLGGGPTDDIRPSIANGVVVWQAGPDGSGDIWYGDTQGTANVLYDGVDERNPHTDGTRVIWEHHDGLDLELFVTNLASPGVATPLTSDAIDDLSPQVDGPHVVWVKDAAPGDSEIWYVWNGGPAEVLPASRGNGRDDVRPRIDGEYFVYESCVDLGDPSELCDIVLVPEPRATLAVGAALAALLGLASLSARRALAPRRSSAGR